MPQSLFISDLHLSPDRPGTLELFLHFLGERARQASALYILGDLFDSWIGDDDHSEMADRVRQALRDLSAHTPVHLQHGNRDFLIGQAFLADTGADLMEEETLVSLEGIPTLLMHGDLLCTDDLDYQQARQMLRSPAFIEDFLAKSLAERSAIVAEYRRMSGEAISMKAEDIMDVNPRTVADFMRKHGATHLIHGHTHRPGLHEFSLDGQPARRIVLAEWHEDRGEVLRVDPQGVERESISL